MALSNFISKLNWWLILVHVTAWWFIRYALVEFFDYNLFHQPSHVLDGPEWRYGSNLWETVRYIGPLVTFIFSFFISYKNKWHWINSLFVFFVTFILSRNDMVMWYELRDFFGLPALFFEKLWIRDLINGTIMFCIALSLFFLKGIARFIDGERAMQQNIN